QIGRDEAVAEVGVLPVGVEIELVLLIRLHRKACDATLVPHREKVLLGRGVIEDVGEVSVLERAGHRVVRAPVTEPAIDPDTIADDRSATVRVASHDPVYPIARLQALRLQVVRKIVRLPRLARPPSEERATERV